MVFTRAAGSSFPCLFRRVFDLVSNKVYVEARNSKAEHGSRLPILHT